MRALSFHPAILSPGGPLIVRAVFERAWHLHDKNGAVLTVTAAPYDGPMAVRVEGRLPAAGQPGMAARLAGRTLGVGRISIELAGARAWGGERGEVRPVDRAALERDMERIGAVAGEMDSFLAGRVAALGDALVSGERDALQDAVHGLIGLGPGLTPAGDDVLCGTMAGLHVFGRRLVRQNSSAWRRNVCRHDTSPRAVHSITGRGIAEMQGRLAATVVEEMEGRTTGLSRTLLSWAARGVAVQPLLDVLWTLGSGEPVSGMETVAAIGHTSGRDMLAGVALAAASVLGGQDDAPLVRAAQHLP